jgi:hypothetical protein
MGLLLLFAKDAAGFTSELEPPWVADWLSSRAERAQKKTERAQAAVERPVDPEAQAKRAAQRETRVADGVASCRVWLEDILRRGLGAARTDRGEMWERMAARMVDAQAPGLADFVRRIPESLGSGTDWDVRTLDLLGQLYLLLRAAEGLQRLPTDLAEDVRAALGWTHSKDEILSGPGIADTWVVLGQIVEERHRLRVRRTWLVGRTTSRRALLLDFAAGSQALEQSVAAGTEFDGELAFYPGGAPLRALVKTRADSRLIQDELGAAADAAIESGLHRYATALGSNPWTNRWPLILAGACPVREGSTWRLADASGASLRLKPSFSNGLQLWRLVSASGGAHSQLTILTEWDGEFALPLSALGSGNYIDLAARLAA